MKTELVGMKLELDQLLINKYLLDLKIDSDAVTCATGTKTKNSFNYGLKFCNEKLSFICIQHPLTVLSSIMFSRMWHKIVEKESCYSIEDTKQSWWKANETCHSFPLQSSLLQSIQMPEDYSVFRASLQMLSPVIRGAWWLNLIQENNELKWLSSTEQSVEFVDWYPHTDFSLSKSAGQLIFDSTLNNNFNWILKSTISKESFICEMHSCQDTGSTYVYIEDRTRTVFNETAIYNYSEIISNFDIRCVPNGWFLSNSISWFKDGTGIQYGHNSSRLTLTIPVPDTLSNIVQLQGYYWCSVEQYHSWKQILSPKIVYTVTGIYTFVLFFEIERNDLSSDCVSFILKRKLSPDFTTFLRQTLPDTFSNTYYWKHSCDKKNMYVHIYSANSSQKEYNVFESIQNAVKLKEGYIAADLKTHFNLSAQLIVRSIINCDEEKSDLNGVIFTWPTTPIGKYANSEEMCITEEGIRLRRQCLGNFYIGAFWGPVLGSCTEIQSNITVNLHQLSMIEITAENIRNSSLSLKELTATPDELSVADVQYISQVLRNMVNISIISPEVLENIVSTIDHLIEAKDLLEASSQLLTNVSSEISASFESILFNVHSNSQAIKLARNNIAVTVIPLNASESKFSTGGILQEWSTNVTTLYNGTNKQLNKVFKTFEAGIILPDSLVIEKYAVRNANRLALTIHQSFYFSENIEVVSPEIDVSLGNEAIYDIDPPIEMIFKISLIDINTKKSSYKCAYWDQKLNKNFGGWSYKGCFSRFLNTGQMQCLCDHLTSFAVILELKPEDDFAKVHQITLSIITYVGCSLSIFGLSIIIFTFIIFRKWRKDLKHKALFNLSLALISFLIIFLSGIENGNGEHICVFVAVCLHYFILASFTWMLVEAVMQYLSFVKVIGTYIPCFMQKAMVFAWGTPLMIVLVVSSVNYKLYSSKSKYCWLSNEAFYYAVAAPILLMLTLNFIIFLAILYSNTCGRPNKRLRSNQTDRKEAVTTAKAMFCVSVLLGLSWIFGFLAVKGAKLLFQYLFALTTTLQGFLMCVFFVFRQKSTRDLWLNLIYPVATPDASLASHMTGATNATNRIFNNYSRQSTPERLSKVVYKSRLSYITFH